MILRTFVRRFSDLPFSIMRKALRSKLLQPIMLVMYCIVVRLCVFVVLSSTR